MKKFIDIGPYRKIVQGLRSHWDFRGFDEAGEPIYKHDKDYPKIKFTGTTKIHGTNGAIVKYKDKIVFQNREVELSITRDNYNFYITNCNTDLTSLFEGIEFNEYIALYGEWCGKGIQKGVAVSQLQKMFVIFAAKIDGIYVEYDRSIPEKRIFNINDFGKFEVEIDFNFPEKYESIFEEITNKVEEECPVGKYFGVSGVGEGVVWHADIDGNRHWFKVKGKKHSVVKTEKIASSEIENIEDIKKFVEYAVSENRLKQGIDYMLSNNIKIIKENTGQYLKWVCMDVAKEENDTMMKNGFDWKYVSNLVSYKAREYYLKFTVGVFELN